MNCVVTKVSLISSFFDNWRLLFSFHGIIRTVPIKISLRPSTIMHNQTKLLGLIWYLEFLFSKYWLYRIFFLEWEEDRRTSKHITSNSVYDEIGSLCQFRHYAILRARAFVSRWTLWKYEMILNGDFFSFAYPLLNCPDRCSTCGLITGGPPSAVFGWGPYVDESGFSERWESTGWKRYSD